MIRLKNITVRFGGITAVKNCSFDIKKEKITGLIGPNGAGKSTAFNAIAGHLIPDQGEIVFNDEPITQLPAHQRHQRGLSRTFQLAQEFSRLSTLENLMVAAKDQAGESLFTALCRRGLMWHTDHAVREQAEEILAFLELDAVRHELAGNLSGGQKKLLELGRALMSRPKLILLDEIGAGINRTLLGKIADKIRTLNREHGYTICLVEHDLDFVQRLCDHVIVMSQGQVLMEGNVTDVRNDPRVIETYFGGGKYGD